jgi:two-component system, sensor histidine kinase and response regulator
VPSNFEGKSVAAFSSDLGVGSIGKRVRGAFVVSSAIALAFLISLIVRSAGSYYTPVDGWGVDVFELLMGAICIGRYFEKSWRSSSSRGRTLPLVLGAAIISWAVGDVAITIESLGGASPSTPSVADGFYLCSYPLFFVAFILVIRRGNSRSVLATSLDGIIAGLGVATLFAAFAFSSVVRIAGGGILSTATSTAYPVGDLLLFCLAIGGLAILPKEYRRFLVIASCALAVNAVGDSYNLLQPNSKVGYITNAAAWPISLLLFAIAAWIQPANAKVQLSKAESAGTEKAAGFAFPVLGALTSVAVLLTASIGHIGRPAVAIATATIFVAGLRLTFTIREAQALNSARFRSLIDNAWDLIVVTEADFKVAYVTPSSQRVLDYAPEDLQGNAVTDIVHPDDTNTMVAPMRLLNEKTAETAAFETRVRHRNGVWRTIAWTATNLLGDPSVRGYVLNGTDVTEARHAAEDLAAARDGALMASKAKSEFLSTMSHEIRTPMNGVIGLTDLLLETTLDRDQEELATGVKVSAENLLAIINGILDFSKVEAGKLELEEVVLSVPEIADNVGRILAEGAHSNGIELLIDVHPDVPSALLGDVVRIQQVLLNLGSNAVKFSAEGEVIIRVAVLHEDTERVALRFDVIDSGIGIALEDQQRLFSAFAQADSSTTRKFGGTGLGLAICRQLVELMGGTLGLTSAPGEGSTFWFELSLLRAGEAATVQTDVEHRSLIGLRALIVDDNATNRKILRRQLVSWGVESVDACDAYEALSFIATAVDNGRTFDIGVIDLNMPGMDGIELAGALKADPDTAAMKLFLLSSSGTRLGPAETHLRGFAASLTKPVRSSELFDCLITNLNSDAPPLPAVPTLTHQPEVLEMKGTILLVEDNKMNQLVGSKVLSKLGYEFRIANNGIEAVSAIQEGSYAAVLMDCQMPEMDGYEATAEIRRIEGATRHTPIIAMTAAAMEGDREACIDAGMDDYITKPVREAAVASVLEQWAVRPVSDGAETTDDATSVNDEHLDDGLPAPLDQSQIELLRSLDEDDGSLLAEIIDQYLTQTVEGRKELVRLMDGGDPRGLERAAHTIRGASANVGAKELAAICAEMEAQGRFEQLEGIAELMERFDHEFVRVQDALNGL